MQSTRHRPNQLISDINVAGFGSIMLALLWLFMFIRTYTALTEGCRSMYRTLSIQP